MYPPPRPTSRPSGSAATSTRTNPLWSNNDRDDIDQRRYSAESAVTTQRAIGDSESELSGSQSMDDRSAEQARETQRLNQIIQVMSKLGLFRIAGYVWLIFFLAILCQRSADSRFFSNQLPSVSHEIRSYQAEQVGT